MTEPDPSTVILHGWLLSTERAGVIECAGCDHRLVLGGVIRPWASLQEILSAAINDSHDCQFQRSSAMSRARLSGYEGT